MASAGRMENKKKQKQNNKQPPQPLPVRPVLSPHADIPDKYSVLSEGKANVLYETANQSQVFYNPAMETNRDISIAMVNVFIKILEEEEKAIKKGKPILETQEPCNFIQYYLFFFLNLRNL